MLPSSRSPLLPSLLPFFPLRHASSFCRTPSSPLFILPLLPSSPSRFAPSSLPPSLACSLPHPPFFAPLLSVFCFFSLSFFPSFPNCRFSATAPACPSHTAQHRVATGCRVFSPPLFFLPHPARPPPAAGLSLTRSALQCPNFLFLRRHSVAVLRRTQTTTKKSQRYIIQLSNL